MKKILSIITLSLVLSGCSFNPVQKTMYPIGGSKSDGTVKMAYEIREFERIEVNERQGARDAAKKCRAWGYEGAEAFGGSMSKCTNPGGYTGCVRTEVVVEYQCLGGQSASF